MIKYNLFSENRWVFPDEALGENNDTTMTLHVARGANVMMQILTDLDVKNGDTFSFGASGADGICVKVYQLVPVRVRYNSAPRDCEGATEDYEKVKDFVTKKAPFDVYDATAPLEDGIVYEGRLALAVRFTAPTDVKAETKSITLDFEINGEKLTVPVELTVHKVAIPDFKDSKLTVVNWIYKDHVLKTRREGMYSDKYWQQLEKLIDHLTDIRNNHFSIVQGWKYDSGEAVRDENGKVVDIDLSNLERSLKMAEKAGMTKLYGPYISHWEKWDDSELYLMWDYENRCNIKSAEGYRQMKLYFKRVKEMLERNNWQDKFIQPLVDEPQFQNADNYRILCGIVREIFPEVVIHDPVEVYNIAGSADIFCVKQSIYEDYIDEFRKLQDTGVRMTVYSCGYPAGDDMNRVLDLPLFAGRLLFWMCHRYNFEGFLHWGYHVVNTFEDYQNRSKEQPTGNSAIVYNYGDDIWESMRSNGQRAGAEDWELLEIIKEKNPDFVKYILDKACRSFTDYETDFNLIDEFHTEILNMADECFCDN